MEIAYDQEFVSFHHDADSAMLEVLWKDTTKMEDEVFRHIMLCFADNCQHYCPRFILIHTRNFSFPIKTSTQAWVDKYVVPGILTCKPDKIAFLASKDMVGQLSIEQLLGEDLARQLNTRFFDTPEEARLWLAKDD